jgi:hypothetical protein
LRKTVGVYDAWQEEETPEPDRVQGELAKVPVPLEMKDTVPPGVTGVEEVSITVAVHVVEDPVTKVEGRQLTEVDVGRVPYTPLFSGTPVMLNPLESARKSRPVLLVTASGNATLVPGPATAV